MRTSLPISKQIVALRSYLRVLRADSRRAYREIEKDFLKRRVTWFIQHLRSQRYRNASELEDVGEECLQVLRHAQALSSTAFFPGDQVTMEVVMKGFERPPERYIVYDFDRHYDLWQVTKAGLLFKRGPQPVYPSSRIDIRLCTEPLPPETQREAGYFRSQAMQLISDARDSGKLDDIITRVRKRRERQWGY